MLIYSRLNIILLCNNLNYNLIQKYKTDNYQRREIYKIKTMNELYDVMLLFSFRSLITNKS